MEIIPSLAEELITPSICGDLAVPDHIADGGCHGHDLEGRSIRPSTPGTSCWEMTAVSTKGELDGNLMLLVGRKNVNDAVDGVGCTDGMQGWRRIADGRSPRRSWQC